MRATIESKNEPLAGIARFVVEHELWLTAALLELLMQSPSVWPQSR